MTKKISWILLLFTCILSSCNNPEFTIEGELKNAGTQNLRFIYYSSDEEGGKIIETLVPVVNDKFQFKGETEQPTVIWIFGPNRQLLTPIYVESSDKININGSYTDPYNWKSDGNELEERWSQWRNKHAKLLKADEKDSLNSAIEKYIKAHSDDKVSALSMLCFYNSYDNQPSFDKHWKMLKPEAYSDGIANAVIASQNHIISQAMQQKVLPIQLYAFADSMATLNPNKAKATLLYFWRKQEERHDSCIINLKEIYKQYSDSNKLQIADINFDTDTVKWRRQVRLDSITDWNSYWAIGAEMNLSLRRLEVARTPYIILIDSAGNQLYRGGKFEEAKLKLKKHLDK